MTTLWKAINSIAENLDILPVRGEIPGSRVKKLFQYSDEKWGGPKFDLWEKK